MIVATIITNLLICHVVEPYVLYRHAFGTSPGAYYRQNYGMIAIFTAALLALDGCMLSCDGHWRSFLVNGCISVGVSCAACVLVVFTNRNSCRQLLQLIKEKSK